MRKEKEKKNKKKNLTEGQHTVGQIEREAQLPQRNSASAAHVYLGWLTDRTTVQCTEHAAESQLGCIIF